jgi:hypothetical protein
MEIDRDTASIVLYRDRSIRVHRDSDMLRMTSHRLIDRVIYDLPHEMMQTALISRTDVHTRTLADWLETFEDLDIGTIVRSS